MSAAAKSGRNPVRVSKLQKLRLCEQVAAICYRMRGDAIEFLLVRTRGSGRWTFPKGSSEPGLTHSQAAALEAFEEAGVHGRIEDEALMIYSSRKPGGTRSSKRAAEASLSVSAHLCRVSRLGKPKESNRERTWFSPAETKDRLREGRKKKEGDEFARVVTKAVARIQRGGSSFFADAPSRREVRRKYELGRVPFEAAAMPYLHQGQSQGMQKVLGGTRRVITIDGGASRRSAAEQKLFRVQ